MSNEWNFLDEILRLADYRAQKPQKPLRMSDLISEFDKLIPEHDKSWSRVTDPVPPPPPAAKEASMASLPESMRIALYTCPACKKDAYGMLRMRPAAEQPDDDYLNSITGVVNIRMQIVGMRADAHDCTPKVTR